MSRGPFRIVLVAILALVISWASAMVAYAALMEMWSIRASVPVGIEGAAGAFIDGKFYVSHGFNSLVNDDSADARVYDPMADSWTPLASAGVPRSELVGAAVDGKLYAIGGRFSGVLDAVEIYDPASDTWSSGASMPTARAGLGAAVVDGKIYVVGGRTGTTPGTGTPLDVLEIYDPASDTWSSGASMPTARMGVYSTTAFDGKVYVIGGFNDGLGGALTTVEIYDPTTDSWDTGPAMPTARSNGIAGVCLNNIYVIGGSGSNPIGDKLDTVEKLEPVSGIWSAAPSLPLPANEITAGGVSAGNLIMATGSGIFGLPLDQNFAFECEETTAIDLSSFKIEAADGQAVVNWETATEVDNAGFNIYRALSSDGPWVQVNSTLIAAEGDPVAGTQYTFTDTPGRGIFYYRLEDIDFFGVNTVHEPTLVEMGAAVRIPWYRPVLPDF